MVKEFTPEEQATIAMYNHVAENWANDHMTGNYWQTYLDQLQQVTPQGKLIEVGSGGGRDAQKIIAKGYDYTGMDVSDGLLNIAKGNNPAAKFTRASIYNPPFQTNTFDCFWSAATLLHIPKEKAPNALLQIARICKPMAPGFISLKEGYGEQNVVEQEDYGPVTRRFSFYEQEEFADLLKDHGYNILSTDKKVASPKTTWLTFLVQVR